MLSNIMKWISLAALTPLLCAADLSSYRDFQLGMNLSAVEKKAEMAPADVKIIHQRPAVIEDLHWLPRRFPGPSPETDPVKEILFSFYNSQLFRMVVSYDRYKTEGLTEQDMIDGISVTYGQAGKPGDEIVFPGVYSEKVAVIARWEDSRYALNLVRSPYQPAFALVLFSKQLDTSAQAAVIESKRLDDQEAPQREAGLLKKRGDEIRIQQEKARLVNKPGFRP
jgi:hypothetical protein